MTYRTDRDLEDALADLRRADPALIGLMLNVCGQPRLRQHPADFSGLTRIIVGQQVSTSSAAAIFGRLEAAFDPLTAASLLAADPEVLRQCGLSGAKIRTLEAVARATETGALQFDRIGSAVPAAARDELLAITGIGPWTADIFLLFCLGYPDVWPSGDLALQEAARALLGHPVRLTTRELDQLGERWRPNRGAAAHLLWAYYRVVDRRRRGSLDQGGVPAQHVATGTER